MPVLVQKREGCIEVVSKFAHVLSNRGWGGVRNCAFLALLAAVSEIPADFQNCHIWA